MSPLWPFAALVSGLSGGWISARRAVDDPDPADLRENHRGVEVPVVLGAVLVRTAGAAAALSLVLALLAGPVVAWPVAVVTLVGTFVLSWVGHLDDRSQSDERGVGHLRSLVRGNATTGILKLVAGFIVAAGVALAIGGGPLRIVLVSVFVALSINVTNALDVRPGRAVKWALVVLLATGLFLRARDLGMAVIQAAYVGAGVGTGWFDVRERGMLGDAGSNPLGLVVGAAIASLLPTVPLVVATLALAALQVAAETITISRLIEAMPPIRWFDRLGRRD